MVNADRRNVVYITTNFRLHIFISVSRVGKKKKIEIIFGRVQKNISTIWSYRALQTSLPKTFVRTLNFVPVFFFVSSFSEYCQTFSINISLKNEFLYPSVLLAYAEK